MKKNTVLAQYVQTIVETYMDEEFTAVTRKITTSSEPTDRTFTQQKFDLEQLRKIRTLEQVQGYVIATLSDKKLGEGQGRLVYKLDGGKVLKVARNAGGVGQNQAEAYVCTGTSEAADLFPKVFEVDPNNFWLVTEEAVPMTPENFVKLTGLSWKDFQSALKGAFQSKALNVSEIDKANFIKASRNPFFSRIVRIIKECKYEPGDIAKLDSWGVIRGKPVILDSGFTEAVNQAY